MICVTLDCVGPTQFSIIRIIHHQFIVLFYFANNSYSINENQVW